MAPAYVSVEEAIPLPGLRVAFTRGVPGPWGEAVKAFLSIKGIPFTPVIQDGGLSSEALVAWTGQNSHWWRYSMTSGRASTGPRH